MKFLSWILLFCFLSNSFASTGAVSELEKALNDYQYDMVVEWDQQDKEVASRISSEFFAKLDNLFKTQGLSNEEVMTYLEARVKDQKKLEELKAQMAVITKKSNSNEELARLLTQNSSSLEMRGASWNGTTTVLAIGGLVAIAALIAYQIVFNLNHYCAQERRYESCSMVDEQECGWPGGEYTCWDTGFMTESCSEATSCEKWEKR